MKTEIRMLDRILLRNGFATGYGSVAKQTTEWMKEQTNKCFVIHLHDECCSNLDHHTSYISPNINIMGWSKEDKQNGYRLTVRSHGAKSDKKWQESRSHSAND
jgi:hypothetical protein